MRSWSSRSLLYYSKAVPRSATMRKIPRVRSGLILLAIQPNSSNTVDP
ncbi:MAG: hypothetical protein VXY82_08070 [Planctomycetota bacterium]|nr:hypothetical protein [Planctomycetota bacterium]MEC7979289.1 hypothetical protein [Planctomycetota bacterium]MEC8571007.1 hypothetical protein [Planctomycetota bacterium]